MIQGIVLASRNKKKCEELQALLAPLDIEVLPVDEFGGVPTPEETGNTFEENASIKAKTVALTTRWPALADDSGLVVDALNGEPGVRSARFAGETATDADNNALLLKKLDGVVDEKRTAAFVCSLALAMPDGTVTRYEGRTEGRILSAPEGENGFGYDPLFYSNDLNKTFAQASIEEKSAISHRGRAMQKFVEELRAQLA